MLPILIITAAAIVAPIIFALILRAQRAAESDWAAFDDAGLTVVCSKCQKHLRGPVPEPGRTISHGLCEPCATAQAGAEIAALRSEANQPTTLVFSHRNFPSS